MDDLNIDNYTMDDIYHLFKIQNNGKNATNFLDEETMKRAKRVVLLTHPDKSRLDAKYFLFYCKAYKKLYAMYEFVNKSRQPTEYEDVLNRPENLKQFGLSKKDIDEFLIFIAYIGLPFHIYYNFRPNLKDENDNIFIELGLASNCDYIVTKNIKDFSTNNQLKFKDLKIITPAEFAKKWREENEI